MNDPDEPEDFFRAIIYALPIGVAAWFVAFAILLQIMPVVP